MVIKFWMGTSITANITLTNWTALRGEGRWHLLSKVSFQFH